jgi:tetratricopeptide (TPR) repeat protein
MSSDAAASLFERAEDYSKDENYAAAAPLYDQAVAALPAGSSSFARYLANRAHNSIKLKRYEAALQDCDKALSVDPSNARVLHRRGLALFYLDRFTDASAAFTAAKDAGFEGDLSLWQRKCTAELEREAANLKPVAAPAASAAPIVHKIEALPSKKAAAAEAAPAQPPQPVGPLTLAQKTREQSVDSHYNRGTAGAWRSFSSAVSHPCSPFCARLPVLLPDGSKLRAK